MSSSMETPTDSIADSAADSAAENELDLAGSSGVSFVDRAALEGWLAEIRQQESWAAWATKLSDRKAPEGIAQLIPRTDENPLLWSLPSSAADDGNDDTERLVAELSGLKRKARPRDARVDWNARIEQWCEDAAHRTSSMVFAVECLAWAHALPRLAPRVSQEIWLALFGVLFDRAADASCASMAGASSREILTTQLLGGELPLALAYQFPKNDACRSLANLGRRLVADSLVELLDGEGVLRADCVADWRRYLACWTRVMYLDRDAGGERIAKESRLQFEWIVRQTLRMRRGHGHLILEPLSEQLPSIDTLLRAALAAGGDRLDQELFAIATGRKKESSTQYELPTPGENSEWAEIAILRSNWTPDSIYLGSTFHGRKLHSELGARGLRLWCGECTTEVRVDGVLLASDGDWEQLCWEADDEGQYTELEMQLAEGWRLQRQFYLPHEDQFAFVADVILGPRRGAIEYRGTYPWSATVACRPEAETSEVALASRKPFGWILPLALNEWRSAARHEGQFDGQTLQLQASGSALYAPLFIDLNPDRARKPRTWRQLTVAQELHILAKDEAVAYRVQIGDEQWAIYRSLVPPGNRTFLGHNLITEFVLGRFSAEEGTLEPLIEIEA